jgi:hypothetical protein
MEMYMTRSVFQTLAMLILGGIVYVWLFLEESARTIPIVILILLFVLLSLYYLREGYVHADKRPSKMK